MTKDQNLNKQFDILGNKLIYGFFLQRLDEKLITTGIKTRGRQLLCSFCIEKEIAKHLTFILIASQGAGLNPSHLKGSPVHHKTKKVNIYIKFV